jgi:Fur family ferric uptake transcriptional regulator
VIRQAGLRATASRIAVLRMLGEADRPLSHADIVDALTDQPWDRATLYRNLIDLVNAGLARKVELGDRVWRFDRSSSSHPHDAAVHPHFVCTVCGDVACLPEVSISTPTLGIPKSLRDRHVEVHVRGVCDACEPGAA